jgi:hypothetical protein
MRRPLRRFKGPRLRLLLRWEEPRDGGMKPRPGWKCDHCGAKLGPPKTRPIYVTADGVRWCGKCYEAPTTIRCNECGSPDHGAAYCDMEG